MPLCLIDLAQLTGGTIHFGPMPPRDGEWAAIGRIALDSRLVEPGDVFWRLPGLPGQTKCSLQHALFRGASGIVAQGASVSPWPGTFCLEVANPLEALTWLVDRLEENAAGQNPAELKVLQLCRYQALDITPPSCGRPAGERYRSRCSRPAA
jgi:UDP-N-acetylmuramyl pentapeptide synthase